MSSVLLSNISRLAAIRSLPTTGGIISRAALTSRPFSTTRTCKDDSKGGPNSNIMNTLSMFNELAKKSAKGTSGNSSHLLSPLSQTGGSGRKSLNFEEQSNLIQNEDFGNLYYLSPESIPRTGPKAGRSIAIGGPMDLSRALRVLHRKNVENNVRTISLRQNIYEKPGKKRQRIRIERNKRKFKQTVKHLFELVSEARRKGY